MNELAYAVDVEADSLVVEVVDDAGRVVTRVHYSTPGAPRPESLAIAASGIVAGIRSGLGSAYRVHSAVGADR
ncbi:hypothetical protein [Herbiconiux sp. UC225_62]|uniref:hypothetical protein n=1 Tax=Herbiconiux sp. UC225_62 TaxID=3350168 RepID=UPI0036D309F9